MAWTLSEIVARLGGELHGEDRLVARLAPLDEAGADEIAFVTGAKHADALRASAAGAVIVKADLLDIAARPAIVCADPYVYFARLAGLMCPPAAARAAGAHPSAAVAADAQVAASAEIREFVSIGAGAVIGERVLLMAGTVVEAGAVIGDDCVLHPRVVVHHGCVVGARCILHAGAVIGADGFGNAWAGDHWEKIPQIGRAVLGDDVEIGANTTIDRGALADTVIERGVRLDNLIHIAHNCRVGAHTAMAACVGVAGSTSIGANCMIGGAAMISGHLKIGDRVHISGGTLVAKNLDKPGQYTAVYPLATHKEWLGNAAHVRQLGKLAARVKQLEARLAAANATDPHSTKEPQ